MMDEKPEEIVAMEEDVARDENLAAKIEDAVAALDSDDGEQLATEMNEATDLAEMAKDAPNWSRAAIIRMQSQAFKMAKRDRRLGRHVIHPVKKRRYGVQADAYYAGINSLKIHVQKAANTDVDADFMEMEICSAQ